MIVVKDWRIKLSQDGTPTIIVSNEKYQSYETLQLDSKDIVFKQSGITFRYVSKSGKVKEYECLYDNLSKKQPPTPIDQLMILGAVTGRKRHSLVFLYELLAGVVLSTKPVVKQEPLDVDGLLRRYAYLEQQLAGVDFKKVADDLYRRLTGKGVTESGK